MSRFPLGRSRPATATVAVLLLISAADAWAQSIAGTIRDSTGLPLDGVTVAGRSTGSGGPDIIVETAPDGEYRLLLPAPGAYDLVVFHPGFAEHHSRAIRVGEAEHRVDVTLRTATFAEEVRVAADLGEIHTTGSRLGLSHRETPAAVDIVTQDVIQARGAETASTALRHVTGLTSSLRPGASAVFSSRGFIENSIGVLFNGVRVQSSTVTMRNYDAFNFDRVEVVRGPASVLHGEGASTGAINFVRRDARPGKTRVDGLLETGDRDRLRFGIAVAGSATDRHSYAVSFARNRFETHVQDNVHAYNHLTGAFRTAFGGMSVGVEGDLFVSSVEDPYWGTPLVDGRIDERLFGRNYNRSPNNRYDDTVGWGRLTAAAGLAPAMIYNGQVYVYRADRDWRNSYGFELLPDTGRVQRRAVENLAYDHRLWGTRHDLTTDVTIGGLPGRWVVGVDLSATDFSSPRSYGPRVSVDLLEPEAADFVAPPRADDRRADLWQASAYSELRLDLADPLSVVLGGRAGRLSNDIARPASDVAFEQSFTPIDGRVGAVFAPMPDLSLYGQYATGSEPIGALLILGPDQSEFDLARSALWEAGVKATLWDGRADVTAAVYRLAKRDLTTADPEDGTRTVQVGKQSSRGVELSIVARPWKQWLIEANLAALDAQYDLFVEGETSRTGNLPPNVPELVANLGTTWRPTPLVEGGFWLTHVGRRAADTTNLLFQPAYTTIDPFVRVALGRAADLTVRVRNAADTRYVEWATRAFGVTNVYFGEPRRLIATLRLRL